MEKLQELRASSRATWLTMNDKERRQMAVAIAAVLVFWLVDLASDVNLYSKVQKIDNEFDRAVTRECDKDGAAANALSPCSVAFWGASSAPPAECSKHLAPASAVAPSGFIDADGCEVPTQSVTLGWQEEVRIAADGGSMDGLVWLAANDTQCVTCSATTTVFEAGAAEGAHGKQLRCAVLGGADLSSAYPEGDAMPRGHCDLATCLNSCLSPIVVTWATSGLFANVMSAAFESIEDPVTRRNVAATCRRYPLGFGSAIWHGVWLGPSDDNQLGAFPLAAFGTTNADIDQYGGNPQQCKSGDCWDNTWPSLPPGTDSINDTILVLGFSIVAGLIVGPSLALAHAFAHFQSARLRLVRQQRVLEVDGVGRDVAAEELGASGKGAGETTDDRQQPAHAKSPEAGTHVQMTAEANVMRMIVAARRRRNYVSCFQALAEDSCGLLGASFVVSGTVARGWFDVGRDLADTSYQSATCYACAAGSTGACDRLAAGNGSPVTLGSLAFAGITSGIGISGALSFWLCIAQCGSDRHWIVERVFGPKEVALRVPSDSLTGQQVGSYRRRQAALSVLTRLSLWPAPFTIVSSYFLAQRETLQGLYSQSTLEFMGFAYWVGIVGWIVLVLAALLRGWNFIRSLDEKEKKVAPG